MFWAYERETICVIQMPDEHIKIKSSKSSSNKLGTVEK